jgi:hypothetical protein
MVLSYIKHSALWGVCLFIMMSVHAAQARKAYAMLPLRNGTGVSQGEADIISDRLRAEIFNTGRVILMEREQMQSILKEQGFQHSGVCEDEACMVQIGEMLGVELLVSGSLGKLGTLYLFNVRAINVETGRIVRVVSEDIRGDIEEVVEYLGRVADKLTTEKAPEKPPEIVIIDTEQEEEDDEDDDDEEEEEEGEFEIVDEDEDDVDDDEEEYLNDDSAPTRPIVQTALGIGLSGYSVMSTVVGIIAVASGGEELMGNGVVLILAGVGTGVSGSILLSRAKAKWNVYNEWEREHKKTSQRLSLRLQWSFEF